MAMHIWTNEAEDIVHILDGDVNSEEQFWNKLEEMFKKVVEGQQKASKDTEINQLTDEEFADTLINWLSDCAFEGQVVTEEELAAWEEEIKEQTVEKFASDACDVYLGYCDM